MRILLIPSSVDSIGATGYIFLVTFRDLFFYLGITGINCIDIRPILLRNYFVHTH